VYLLVFHAHVNEMHGSRSKIPSKKISSGSVARRDLILALKKCALRIQYSASLVKTVLYESEKSYIYVTNPTIYTSVIFMVDVCTTL
jgi:hypothetical protein